MNKLIEWFKRLFGKKPVPVVVPVPPTPQPTFVADFTSGQIDPMVWTVSAWGAPGGKEGHQSAFTPDHAFIERGVLCLALTQTKSPEGVILSFGAELATIEQFSYGTYEWVMRASSTAGTPDQVGTPVSGTVTGCFLYRPQAETEIDVEVEGGSRSDLTQFTSWVGESNPPQTTPVTSSSGKPHERFFTYTVTWMPNKIEFRRDGVLVATHTKVVPSQKARVMMNHWGTDSQDWGGTATLNTSRYMWIKSFKYTPLS